jgi:hypothetical protein
MLLSKKLIYTYIFLITLVSCQKKEIQSEDKTVSVEYFLSDEDKDYFDVFKNNMFIQFRDSLNNILDFKAENIYSIITCKESNLDKGEALSVMYDCLSGYLPDFSFNCRLSARPDSKADLSIVFGTGTFWTEKANDYNFSWFYLRPNISQNLITKNYFGAEINQYFLDSIVLLNKKFHNVFQITYSSTGASGFGLSKFEKCYFTNEKGVIAFENTDKKLWVRK